MKIEIRTATKADSQNLTPLINDFVKFMYGLEVEDWGAQTPPHGGLIAENMFAPDLAVQTLVAEDAEGKITGFLCYHLTFWIEDNRPGGLITAISVAKGNQQKGIGQALLAKALENISRRGGAYAIISVHRKNDNAISFYKSLGGDVYDGERLILMPTKNRKQK